METGRFEVQSSAVEGGEYTRVGRFADRGEAERRARNLTYRQHVRVYHDAEVIDCEAVDDRGVSGRLVSRFCASGRAWSDEQEPVVPVEVEVPVVADDAGGEE